MKYLYSSLVFLSYMLIYSTQSIDGRYFNEKSNATTIRKSNDNKPCKSIFRCQDKEDRKVKKEENKTEDMEMMHLQCDKPIVENGYIDHHINCYAIGNIVKKIEYNVLRNDEQKVMPIASACLRCGVCIAVAKQLNETLLEAQKNSAYLPLKESYNSQSYKHNGNEELDTDFVTSILRSRCCHSFENYGLREYAGERSITEAHSYTDHVPTAHDGQWPEKLGQICNAYLDDYGEENLYRDWLAGKKQGRSNTLINLLCRGSGLFRDCWNMDLNVNTTGKSLSTVASPCWRLE